jgi:SAM-dependent methyltransferase
MSTLSAKYFSRDNRLTIIDIGCGRGELVSQLGSGGHDAVGLDIAGDLLQLARTGSPTTRLVNGDAEQLPFADGSADRVSFIEVLEHVDDPRSVVSEGCRVLRPGGVIVAAVPTGYTERLFSRLHPSYMENATHVRIFSEKDVYKLLSDCGLRVLMVETKNLYWAVFWLVHSVLRTNADHTGTVTHRPGVGRWLRRVFHLLESTAPTRFAIQFLEKRVGKSWYFYATKEAGVATRATAYHGLTESVV